MQPMGELHIGRLKMQPISILFALMEKHIYGCASLRTSAVASDAKGLDQSESIP